MRKEIDIVVKAAGKSCVVVEKASHVSWTLEELLEAQVDERYQEEDRILPPDGRPEVSGPFPGCLQQFGATATFTDYHPVGQTEHFVIFAP